MLGWFRKLLPHEDRFFDLFDRHVRFVVGGAEALERLLAGKDVEANSRRIVELEAEADIVAADVLLAVRRSFVTPFDRSDIQDLIQSMDDTIDTMHKTVKTIRLFEKTEFDPLMHEMGSAIVEAAHLVAEAIPLLSKVSANAAQITALTEKVTAIEDRSDALHEEGLKGLLRQHGRNGDAMAYILDSQLFGQLEKVVDRFEDVADEISGIVIENV